jgi:hypothetical protein
VLVTALTFLAFLVNGYHPYAEDGGIYLPEIKRLLDPGLYPRGAEFVVGHLQYSLFAPMMAGLIRESRLSVEMALLVLSIARGARGSGGSAGGLDYIADRGDLADANGSVCDGAELFDSLRSAGSGRRSGVSVASVCN